MRFTERLGRFRARHVVAGTAAVALLAAAVLVIGPLGSGGAVEAGQAAPAVPAAPVEGPGTELTGAAQPPLPPTPPEPAAAAAAPGGTPVSPATVGSAPPPVAQPPTGQPPTGRPTAGPPPSALSARYATTSVWDGGLVAQITVSNGGDREQDWRVELVLPDGVRVGNAWNTRADQRGDRVLLIPPPERPRLRAGESTVLGFKASRNPGAPYAPRSCSVNTRPCE